MKQSLEDKVHQVKMFYREVISLEDADYGKVTPIDYEVADAKVDELVKLAQEEMKQKVKELAKQFVKCYGGFQEESHRCSAAHCDHCGICDYLSAINQM